MSDPMTNLDADDVLASIRRLVAETHADGAASGGEAVKPAQSPLTLDQPLQSPAEQTGPAALVLTPDFRVEKPSAAVTPAAEEQPAPSEPLVLSMEQAVHVPKAEQDETTETEVETLIAEEVQASAHPTEDLAETVADWSAELDDTPDEAAAAHAARLSLEQRIAELEAAVGAQGKEWGMEWEPDGSEDLEAEIPRAMPRAFAEPGARVLRFGPVDAGPVESEGAKVSSDGSFDEASGEAHEVDGVEMAEAKDRTEGEMDEIADAEVIEETAYAAAQEDRDGMSEASEETEAEDDQESAEGVAPDPDPSLEEELALAGYADEDILDEEALRELVAQVIREELQGELGQRITRNLRRLVRREVQRALTLREFE